MPELSEAEYALLFPGREERAKAPSVDMFALFRRLIDEAKAAGTLELVQWLLTCSAVLS
jgi:hypothetical protein